MSKFDSAKLALAKLSGPLQKIAHKHGPKILMGLGATGVVASGVLLVKQTLTVQPILDDHKQELADIKSTQDSFDAEHDKNVAKLYFNTGKKLVVHYGLPVSIGLSGLAAILVSNGILEKRNAALVAAYNTVSTAFGEYRKRVANELGEERELEVYRGVRREEVVDEETKEVTTVLRADKDPNGLSPYARFFDEYNQNWQKVPEYNLLFLRTHQTYFNDMLRARGYVFLNEVYDALGIPKSQAGQIVGWELSPESDNYIDFNIYDFGSERAMAFVNGEEKSILLDFNVDGPILQNIKEEI